MILLIGKASFRTLVWSMYDDYNVQGFEPDWLVNEQDPDGAWTSVALDYGESKLSHLCQHVTCTLLRNIVDSVSKHNTLSHNPSVHN